MQTPNSDPNDSEKPAVYDKSKILQDISTYTDDELAALVTGIRERRMRVATAVAKAVAHSAHLAREKLENQYEKRVKRFENKAIKIDTLLTELENLLPEILAIRIQMGDDITKDDKDA